LELNMTGLSRRRLIAGAAALPLTSIRSLGLEPDKVRFGMLYPNLVSVIHAIAKRIGAYERHNLIVVETPFKSGQATAGVEQLWRGNLDFYMGGAPEIPRLNSRLIESGGAPPLAVVSGTNPGHTSLVLSNKLKPKSIDELLDQRLRIAVSSLSSVHRAYLRGYLRLERKVDLDSLPWRFVSIDGGNMIAALMTDQIDAFLHSEPTTTLAIINNAGHLFMQAARGDMGPNPPPNSFLTSRRDFLQQKPDVARRFLRAIFDANAAYEASREQMIPAMAEWSGSDEKVIRAAAERMNPSALMTREQAQRWWDFIGIAMIERGEIVAKMDPFRDVFELGYQPL
jgi:ABC-type nitrate/sulfonate/bicarbonate transport system substrate-binding protein